MVFHEQPVLYSVDLMGCFLLTQECISTPPIPVDLAAVCTHPTTWRRLILGVLAALWRHGGWAVAGPVLIFAAVVNVARARR